MSIPLSPLHSEDSLIPSKLRDYEKLPTPVLIASLEPGQPGALKARLNGTMIDGHHRIKVLRDRGVDVNALPREVVPKDEIPDLP